MKNNKLNFLRMTILAGIVAPLFFVLVFTVEGWLRPGYSSLSDFISALSLGSRGWIQIANFVVFGILLAIFAIGIRTVFAGEKMPRAGIVLLIIIAAFYALSGPFIMDPAGTLASNVTIHGTVHGILGGLVFVLMPISMFTFLRRLRIELKPQNIYWWTLIIAVIDAAAVLFFTVVSKSPRLTATFSPWIGLIQRISLIPFMVWLFILAMHILKRVKK